ncbi:MAG TPA: hypothetical protein P5144_10305, partial [Thermoanaerobaculia bacterium]|nr:hypothetical protein [Thermoanaerobaculia bacterium]
MANTFMGRRVSKEVINVGIGGQIERSGAELPPRSTVRFQAEATVSSIRHKFLEDGTIEEMTVLTIDKDSFEVLAVEAAAEQPELPLTTGTVTAREADAVAAATGVRNADGARFEPPPITGPLLVSCEACGHGRGDHGPNEETGEEHAGPCCNPSCQCTAYAPFHEAPLEEALEPLTVEELDHEMAVGAAGTEIAVAEEATPSDGTAATEPQPEPAPADDQVTTGAAAIDPEPAPRRGGRRGRATP